MLIITSLEEVGMPDFRCLLQSIRRCSAGLPALRIAACTGELSDESRHYLRRELDEVLPFESFEALKQYGVYGKALGHPIGKFAKLFFALEYVDRCGIEDEEIVLFLDPDTYIQRPLAEFIQNAEHGILLLGHEMQHNHLANAPSWRLKFAKLFDEEGPWWATYIAEVNTGVILGKAGVFRHVMRDFRSFVQESDYFEKAMSHAYGHRWHDQDFFRYFLRKTMRTDVGVLDLGEILTTTGGAEKCLFWDPAENLFCTVWDAVPYVLHFAGQARERIPGLPQEGGEPGKAPLLLPRRSGPPRYSPLLDTSPRDVARFVRRRVVLKLLDAVRTRLGRH